jgi:two-component system, LuxR family, response regulator FixJ
MVDNSTATVIVVDDDASIRRALKTQLQILGLNVLVMESALELLASEIPTENALFLLDVHLPGMNGIELCESLATARPGLRTVLMTGHSDRQTRQLMRRVKPAACLFKPFDENALLRVIRKALPNVPNLPH